MRLVAILVVSYVTLSSLVRAEEKPDYFPLQVGNRWVYTLRLAEKEMWEGVETAVVEIATTGTETQANGQEYYRFETTLLSRSLPEWFPEAFFASIELLQVAFYRSDSAGHIFRYIKEWEYKGVQAEELSYDFTFENSRTWTGVRYDETRAYRDTCQSRFSLSFPSTDILPCYRFTYIYIGIDELEARSDLILPGIGAVSIALGGGYNYVGMLSLQDAELGGVHYPLPTGVRSSEWGRVKSFHR